jgi:hypothetical protein
MTEPVEPKDGETPETAQKAARETRNSVMLSATVEGFGGGQQSKHRVRDLSAGGVRIDQPGALRNGATVLVSVGALQLWRQRSFGSKTVRQAYSSPYP